MMKNIRINLYRNPARRGFEFWVSKIDYNGKEYVAKPSEFIEVKPVDFTGVIEPTLFINDAYEETIQHLFNQLWQAGFRPEGLSKHEADAQSRHLEDMRKIASKYLEINL